jgi:biotin carboxylase
VRTVLVLYPGSPAIRRRQLRRYRWAIRLLGLRTVLADDTAGPEDLKAFDEVLPLPPAHEVSRAVEVAAAFCRGRRIDGVLAQWEPSLPAGALLAHRLGLPGPGVEPAFRSINKYLCRRALGEEGVPVPAFTLAASAADVERFAGAHGYPVVLKAVASTLSRLVSLVAAPAEVEPAVERLQGGLAAAPDVRRLVAFAEAAGLDPGCDPTRQFLVEAFCPGAPVETDGVVFRGEALCYGVTEQVLSALPRFYVEGYLLPAERTAAASERIEAVSRAALRAVGLADTGFSVELREAEDAVRVIEVNGRLGWDEGFPELFEATSGGKPIHHAVEVALGRRPRIRRKRVAVAVAYVSCHEDAVVVRVPERREIRRAERAGVRIGVATAPGTRLWRLGHPKALPHLAWAVAKDRRSSRAAFERARAAADRLRFELAPVAAAVPGQAEPALEAGAVNEIGA